MAERELREYTFYEEQLAFKTVEAYSEEEAEDLADSMCFDDYNVENEWCEVGDVVKEDDDD